MKINRRIKGLLGRVVGVRHLKKTLNGRAAILGLHSITKENCPESDPVRISFQSLRQLCALLKEHFTVISLTTLVEKLERREELQGEIVLSFDDGYKDNFELAAPLLSDFGLPATFFVTTNFIGSSAIPFWEASQRRVPRWMDWNDVRELAREGFEIGAHSLNHRDLGRSVGVELEQEIRESKSALEHRLSKRIEHFAFPFGGRANYSDEAISVVQHAGFRSAVTCCGGVVRTGDHLFTLGRLPYSAWYLSPYQFFFDQAREYAASS